MTQTDYYETLGLPASSTIEEIKKAYRRKARLYHPDINPSPDAKDIFISITEAYEFLITNHDKIRSDDQAYKDAMDDWRKYRQDRSRKKLRFMRRDHTETLKTHSFTKRPGYSMEQPLFLVL